MSHHRHRNRNKGILYVRRWQGRSRPCRCHRTRELWWKKRHWISGPLPLHPPVHRSNLSGGHSCHLIKTPNILMPFENHYIHIEWRYSAARIIYARMQQNKMSVEICHHWGKKCVVLERCMYHLDVERGPHCIKYHWWKVNDSAKYIFLCIIWSW